jgi:hypothetical protein
MPDAVALLQLFPNALGVVDFDEVVVAATGIVALNAIALDALDRFVERGFGPAAGGRVGAGEEAALHPHGEGLNGQAEIMRCFATSKE